MGKTVGTEREHEPLRQGLAARLDELINDSPRLRARNFASKFALLTELSIDPPSFYRDLRADHVSARNLDLLVGALATPAEAKALGAFAAQSQSSRTPPPRSLSLGSLLGHPIGDASHWDREFRSLRMAHGFFVERPQIADLYAIYEGAVATPRSLGDYVTTMRNGLILTQWFLNRSKETLEDMMLGGTFLLGLSHAASQAEHLPMHRRSLRLGELFLNKNARCPFLDRLVRDIEGQLLYNTNPEHRSVLKKALLVHDAELAMADKLLQGHTHPIGDCQLVVGESYYNRLSILVKLGISGRVFDLEYARMENNFHQLWNTLSPESGRMLTSNIGREVECFMKILRIRQCLADNQLSKAAEHAEQLIADARAADQELTFFGGYAHYWAGISKRRTITDRSSNNRIEEIDHHASSALRAFSRMGNARMKLNTRRDLMTVQF